MTVMIPTLTDNTCAVHMLQILVGVGLWNVTSQRYSHGNLVLGSAKRKWISVAYLPGKDNTSADYESLNINLDCDWKCNSNIFNQIMQNMPFTPGINLFACRLNHQLQLYASF